MPRLFLLVLLAAWASLGTACRHSAVQISNGGPGDPGSGTRPEPGPPAHVFTPRPHPPRSHPRPPPPPDLRTLPRLVDASARCYGRDRDQVAQRPKPPPRSRNGGKRGGKKRRSARSSGGRGAGTSPGYVPYAPNKGSGATSPGGGGGVLGGASTAPDQSKSSSSGRGRGGPSRTPKEKKRPRPAAPAAEPPPATAAPMGDVAAGADMPAAEEEAPETRREGRRDRKAERERRRREKKDARRAKAANDQSDALAPVDEDAERAIAVETQVAGWPEDDYHDWGQSIYLSNDDTMSLSSAQRVLFAIDNFLPLPLEHIRPHELLNYFSFETAPVADEDDFSVLASIAEHEKQPGIYGLALAVRGRPVDLRSRRNAQLALVVDRSGSMAAEGRMEYLKRGLLQMLGQLKNGDIVHLVIFDHEVCTPISNFVVGRDPHRILESAIHKLTPRGSTDLHSGLRTGYELADSAYQPAYTNRVVMITDALANTGVTDTEMISMISRYYDSRRIRLSGVGVGREFNDALLDRLTERGKGAYVFLGSETEVDAVFGPRFVSLIETTAGDVHFQLHLPPSLRMNVFYGEESSVVKEDVQAIHYFANTSQLFLADLMARGGKLRPQDSVMLTIEYEHPETGAEMLEEYAFTLGDIERESTNVRKGRLIMRFIDGLAWMAARPVPSRHGSRTGAWQDDDGWQECEAGRQDLDELSQGIAEDPEVRRVVSLWEKYCARYERPRSPVQRDRDAPPDRWPGAAEQGGGR